MVIVVCLVTSEAIASSSSVVWAATDTLDHTTTLTTESAPETPKRPTKIKVLQNWFEKTQPAPPDFDPDQAKWEYLKEKHNL